MKIEGDPPPTLVWYHNGEVVVADYGIEIEEQGSFFFPSIEFKHSGVYKVVATNTSGQAEKEVTVSVMSEGCDGGKGGGEINSSVPVAEFGTFVSEQHAHGNKKFREGYEVDTLQEFLYRTIKCGFFYRDFPVDEKVMRILFHYFQKIILETDSKTSMSVSLYMQYIDCNDTKYVLIDDDNRIILQPLTAGEEIYKNEYINASYVDVR